MTSQNSLPDNAVKGVPSFEYILKTVKNLKKASKFNEACTFLTNARKELENSLSQEQALQLTQKLALCTYKNEEISPEKRFDAALDILKEAGPLDTSRNRETLGQAGAIYKRKWRYYGDREALEHSLEFYRRGVTLDGDDIWSADKAYNVINYIFLLELYIAQITHSALQRGLVSKFSDEADHYRQLIIKHSPTLMADQKTKETLEPYWWTLVTKAEAHFGLKEFDEAKDLTAEAISLQVHEPWQEETLVRQLNELLHHKWEDQPEIQQQARAVLSAVVPYSETAVTSMIEGKFGLALSGGGFRASFYHIGVLARLAELDLLRKVEVISCVSGGSILGVHYYLELRKLLQEKTDCEITREDYILLVKRLEQDFLSGVQTNIRTSILKSPVALFNMVFKPGYSRTHRLGELYEEVLYSKVEDGNGDNPRHMDELKISPKRNNDEAEQPKDKPFDPRYDNWQRKNKVPVLILNAACLNTGHSWHFTSDWMGEAPWSIENEVDANTQLNWFYYEESEKEHYKNLRLGWAVAASSCVPGLFKPLSLPELYPNMTVRLVDGGVYDNQGTAALLDKGCEHLLVSDASGQLPTHDCPNAGSLQVPLRASEIVQGRLRNVQHKGLQAQLSSKQLKSLCYIHLKKGLDAEPTDPCINVSSEHEGARNENKKPLQCTDYGIHRDYQLALANIRTDLDSFTDTEAHALMLSGYKMAEYYLPETMRALGTESKRSGLWDFISLQPLLSSPEAEPLLLKQLSAASNRFFKPWRLSDSLRLLATIIFAVLMYKLLSGGQMLMLAAAALLLILAWPISGPLGYIKDWLRGAVFGTVASVPAWVIAQLHLNIFDPVFLRLGNLRDRKRR